MVFSFGIVTACWKGDYFMVKATCASIRHFLGNVPICVIVDGNFSIQELVDVYDVYPLYLSQLANPDLRQRCPGSTRAKLSAIWEGPFDYFLYLDSDAIIWGNVLKELNKYIGKTDFIVMRPPYYGHLPKEEVNRWFFDVDQVLEMNPNFQWENQPYFCAGVFAARRNCFNLDTYLNLERFADSKPDLFQFWDQGIVNYMVFSENQKGNLSYEVLDLQVVTVDHPKQNLEKQFPCVKNRLPITAEKAAIIHFCGRKPFIHKRESFSKPFTASRFLHYQNLKGHHLEATLLAYLNILGEELNLLGNKFKSRIKKTD
jgi:hypothetical protein